MRHNVIPGRHEVANPESIIPVLGYGFRVLGFQPRPGMTNNYAARWGIVVFLEYLNHWLYNDL